MSDKKQVSIIVRIHRAYLEELGNHNHIVHWRLSPEAELNIRNSEEWQEDNCKWRTPPSIVDTMFGYPVTVIADWHGETFEYDTASLNTSV